MRPFDTTVLQDSITILEKTIHNLLLTSYSIQDGREIATDDVLTLLPDLAYIKSALQSEYEYIIGASPKTV